MKTIMRKNLILAITCFTTLLACKNESKQLSHAETLASFDQLIGTWQLEPSMASYEVWKKQDSILVGTGYSLVNGDTILSEFYSIGLKENQLAFEVGVVNTSEVNTYNYILDKADKDEIILRNPDREFPKTLTYQFHSPTHLSITRKGIIAGSEQVMEENFIKDSNQ